MKNQTLSAYNIFQSACARHFAGHTDAYSAMAGEEMKKAYDRFVDLGFYCTDNRNLIRAAWHNLKDWNARNIHVQKTQL